MREKKEDVHVQQQPGLVALGCSASFGTERQCFMHVRVPHLRVAALKDDIKWQASDAERGCALLHTEHCASKATRLHRAMRGRRAGNERR